MSGNFFQEVAKGTEKLQAQFLGPTYHYARKINNPKELGMSSRGSLGALARDVNGLVQYMRILVEGRGQANKQGGRPLGGKFYLKTAGKCMGGGSVRDRYIYVNNVPQGNVPFISTIAASNFGAFQGFIPAVIENTGKMNPLSLFSGFMQKTKPPCRKLNLPADGSPGSAWVADSDIADLDPGLWKVYGKVSGNHVTKTPGRGCAKSAFTNMNLRINGERSEPSELKLKKNPLANLYNLGFGVLLIYLFLHLMKKGN